MQPDATQMFTELICTEIEIDCLLRYVKSNITGPNVCRNRCIHLSKSAVVRGGVRSPVQRLDQSAIVRTKDFLVDIVDKLGKCLYLLRVSMISGVNVPPRRRARSWNNLGRLDLRLTTCTRELVHAVELSLFPTPHGLVLILKTFVQAAETADTLILEGVRPGTELGNPTNPTGGIPLVVFPAYVVQLYVTETRSNHHIGQTSVVV
jgi:hypothetical protein